MDSEAGESYIRRADDCSSDNSKVRRITTENLDESNDSSSIIRCEDNSEVGSFKSKRSKQTVENGLDESGSLMRMKSGISVSDCNSEVDRLMAGKSNVLLNS